MLIGCLENVVRSGSIESVCRGDVIVAVPLALLAVDPPPPPPAPAPPPPRGANPDEGLFALFAEPGGL